MTLTQSKGSGRLLLPVLLLAAVGMRGARPDSRSDSKLLAAIQRGDIAEMSAALRAGANPNAADADGTPALMNAALYSKAAAMRLLLDHGADPKASNRRGATALIWAAADPEKALLLIERGAEVNVRTRSGRTALMTAASAAGGGRVVKALLERGAQVDARDQIDPMPILFSGGGRGTALIEAARVGDLESIRLLVSKGADVNAASGNGATALTEAVLFGRRDVAAYLLDNGASVKTRTSVIGHRILSLASMRGDAEIAKMLIEKGAEVNAQDAMGHTPLMWGAYSDRGAAQLVRTLIEAGADVRARSNSGESAMTWALRHGNAKVMELLRQAGAEEEPMEKAAIVPAAASGALGVEKALALLGESGVTAFKKTGCASCHNHTLPLMAFGMADDRGVSFDTKLVEHQMKSVLALLKPATDILLEGSDVPPDIPVTGSYMLEALAAQNYLPNKLTAALAHSIAMKQAADGRWVGWSPRPPLENGDIQATAMAVRALELYGMPGRRAEFDKRIERARQFLLAAPAASTEEAIMRMWGLQWAGAPRSAVAEAAGQLLGLQRVDGGWAQLPGLSSDAYATGKALVALANTGQLKTEDAVFGRGVRFLRETQENDGSWHVKTRSFAFQPLTDHGFPHGRDQWISAAGTSWAAMALMYAEGAAAQRARR
jgi:N-acyl-D-amino-acid deacylase